MLMTCAPAFRPRCETKNSFDGGFAGTPGKISMVSVSFKSASYAKANRARCGLRTAIDAANALGAWLAVPAVLGREFKLVSDGRYLKACSLQCGYMQQHVRSSGLAAQSQEAKSTIGNPTRHNTTHVTYLSIFERDAGR
jgi:hypothetical protein